MIEIPWNPDPRSLRQFAAIWFPLFAVVVGFLIGRGTGAWSAVQVAWMACAGVSLLGLLWPAGIRPVFLGLLLLTFPIGWVVSHVLLMAIFMLVFLPIGVLHRLRGRDALRLRPPPPGESLWTTVETVQDPAHYTRPS
jgi:hypothetical protein